MTHIIYAPDSPVALCDRCDETWWETDEDDPVDCAVCAE
jgi:formylmethanofuran dehydrogenase subunit E